MKWGKAKEIVPTWPLPSEMEMIAGPLALKVWRGDSTWIWEVWDPDGPEDCPAALATGLTYNDLADAQAWCLAVANGILLQRVRKAWGDPNIWVEFDENHWAAMKSTGDRGDVAVSTDSETACLVRALKAAP